MPEGVSYEGVFGEKKDSDKFMAGQAGGVLGRSRSNLAYLQPSTAATQTVEVQTGAAQLSTIPQNRIPRAAAGSSASSTAGGWTDRKAADENGISS